MDALQQIDGIVNNVKEMSEKGIPIKIGFEFKSILMVGAAVFLATVLATAFASLFKD